MWTVEFDTKGFPDLKALYTRIGKPDHVQLLVANQFKHNYNQVSRAEMYAFMKRHLKLDGAPVAERDFEFSTKEDLTVWTAEHPAPAGDKAGKAHEAALMKKWAELSDAIVKPLLSPKNENQLAEAMLLVGGAWRMMVGRELPEAGQVEVRAQPAGADGWAAALRNQRGETVALSGSLPQAWNGTVVIHAGTNPAALEEGAWGIVVTPYLAGASENPCVKEETKAEIDSWKAWSGYTYGYNPPLLIRRVHDLLTVLAALPKLKEAAGLKAGFKEVTLHGDDDMAAVQALAALIAGPDLVQGLVVRPNGFRFAKLTSQWDTAFVPGAVKYGDLPALLGLCAPIRLTVEGERRMRQVEAMYEAAGAIGEVIWTE